jgi:hypothetical protein
LNWSSDISILGLVRDFAEYVSVLAFGIGLVFGFSFDTAGPAERAQVGRRRRRAAAVPAGGGAARTSEDDATTPTAREQEAAREDARASRTRFGRRRDRQPAQRQ